MLFTEVIIMSEEKKSIFRKQALDRVSSPEELDKYLVVTRPGVWFALIAVIVLLVGVIVWGFLGKLEIDLGVAVIADESGVVALVPADDAESVVNSGKITIAGKEYAISDVGYSKQIITSAFDINILYAGNLAEGQIVLPLKVEADLDSGIYSGEVTVESVKPISFILN